MRLETLANGSSVIIGTLPDEQLMVAEFAQFRVGDIVVSRGAYWRICEACVMLDPRGSNTLHNTYMLVSHHYGNTKHATAEIELLRENYRKPPANIFDAIPLDMSEPVGRFKAGQWNRRNRGMQ